MNTTDFLSGAPKFITYRFNSVNKYVWQTLFPGQTVKEQINKYKTKAERKKEIGRLKSISEEASIIVFLFLLNKFFKEGAKAAREAVDTFKDLGIGGFYIGGNYFSERNEKVLQGDIISEKLLTSLKDERVKKLVTTSNYVSEIFEQYRKLI
jgi:hypothetical protein